jgi:hypothetical protein
MLSFTFLKTSKISFSLSSFLDQEELKGKGGIFLKLEFIELGLTFEYWWLFLLYAQFSFFILFFLYLNLF